MDFYQAQDGAVVGVSPEILADALANITTPAEADNIWALYIKRRPAATAAVRAILTAAIQGHTASIAAKALLMAADARRNPAPADATTLANALGAVTSPSDADRIWSLYIKGGADSTTVVQAIRAAALQGDPAGMAAQQLLMEAQARRDAAPVKAVVADAYTAVVEAPPSHKKLAIGLGVLGAIGTAVAIGVSRFRA